MFELLTQLLLSFGAGGLGGFCIGFALKKIIKIFMVLVGLYLISLFYLVHIEVIKINPTKLLETSWSVITPIINFLLSAIPYLAISGSFALGFTLGVIKG
jgi:uncharacterized membrane protein (Fun14 family)